jgi:hypothetical protein
VTIWTPTRNLRDAWVMFTNCQALGTTEDPDELDDHNELDGPAPEPEGDTTS